MILVEEVYISIVWFLALTQRSPPGNQPGYILWVTGGSENWTIWGHRETGLQR